MATDRICGSIGVEFLLETGGLIGAPWEYAPYVSCYATFGAYRVQDKPDPLIPLNATLEKTPVMQLPAEFAAEKQIEEIVIDNNANDQPRLYRSSRRLEFSLLDDWRQHRGCDAIKFKLFAHSRFSGVPFLDKLEAADVERERPEGICRLELVDLFAHYSALCKKDAKIATQEHFSFDVEDRFIDTKIVDERVRAQVGENGGGELTMQTYQANQAEAEHATTKARVVFRVTLSRFNHRLFAQSTFGRPNMKKTELYSLLPPNRQLSSGGPGFQPLLYNSERSWQRMAQTMQGVVQLYCDAFVPLNEKHKPRYAPSEPALANLHMPLFMSEEGNTVLDEYWRGTEPFFAQHHSEEARQRALATYPLDEKTEAYFLMMLRSSLRRHALSETTFVETIERHFSSQNQSRKLEPAMLLVEEVVADVGCFVATSAYYTADYRLMNTEGLKETKEGKKDGVTPGTYAPDPESHHHLSHMKFSMRALNCHDCKSEKECTTRCVSCGKKMKVRVVSLDSWDSHILNGTSMCDDCEGQAKVAKSVILQYMVGRYALEHRWESRTLEAVRTLFLRHTDIGALGSLVTSAFMNTDNTRMEMQQNDELPLIGSDLDKRAQNDGHCFNIMQPVSKFVRQAERGDLPRDLVAWMKRESFVSEAFQARERQRGVLVLEGTGPTETRVLDLETSYASHSRDLFEKRRAEMAVMRHIRSVMKADKARYERISTLFSGRGMTHYVKRQPAERRVSSFYRSPVHMISVAMKQRFGNHPALTQVAFGKADPNDSKKMQYGVTMGELLRDDGDQHGPALISPFSGKDIASQWEQEVVPMVETISNQAAIMRFSRYSKEEYDHEIYSIFVSRTEASSPQFDFGALEKRALATRTEKKRVEARTQFERLLFSSESDEGLFLLRLNSRVWQLDRNREDRAQLMTFLSSLPGMVDYAFYIERHAPNLKYTRLEIMCLMRKKEALELEKL